MKQFRLKIGLDVDDVLYKCNEYALSRCGAKTEFKDIKKWGVLNNDADERLKEFKNADFWETLPLYEGAVEFVRELQKKADVYFISAVEPEFMGIRGKQLKRDFPFVPSENIFLGAAKELAHVDVLLDDGVHNIINSSATYPVLMRRPWNEHMTGSLAINCYSEFLTLIDCIRESYFPTAKDKKPKIFCLVGSSGGGKTSLIDAITEIYPGLVHKVVSTTTRKMREGEVDGKTYHFVTKEWFYSHKKNFFESTVYAGEFYGTTIEGIEEGLKKGNVIVAIDICGAIAMKSRYPGRVKLVYVDRPKEELIMSILERPVSNEDKLARILALSDEKKNIAFCDEAVKNHTTMENAIKQLADIIREYS